MFNFHRILPKLSHTSRLGQLKTTFTNQLSYYKQTKFTKQEIYTAGLTNVSIFSSMTIVLASIGKIIHTLNSDDNWVDKLNIKNNIDFILSDEEFRD